jgi:hypothetical protein
MTYQSDYPYPHTTTYTITCNDCGFAWAEEVSPNIDELHLLDLLVEDDGCACCGSPNLLVKKYRRGV